jgi:hypothetical protein
MKTRPASAELLHAERQTKQSWNSFPQLCERYKKLLQPSSYKVIPSDVSTDTRRHFLISEKGNGLRREVKSSNGLQDERQSKKLWNFRVTALKCASPE